MTAHTLTATPVQSGARQAAVPVRGTGFRNLFAKEMNAWWRTKTWWVQLALFLGMVVGVPALAAFQMTSGGELAEGPMEACLVFMIFHQLFAAGSAIVTAQGAIVGEKEAGTAAWILSKPVSRASFILSKAAALGLNFLLVGALVPAVAITVAWTGLGLAVSPAGFVLMALAMSLTLAFYLALTLALGTLSRSRAAVAGTAFFVFFVMTQLGQRLPDVVPGGMPFRVTEVLSGQQLASPWGFVVASVASALLLIAAVARFRTTEF